MTSQWLANRVPAVRQPVPEQAVDREIEELHAPFMKWLKDKKLPYIHARSDMRSGIAEGAQDFTVFYQRRTICIEFKSRTGKRDDKQSAWAFLMERQGFTVHLVRTLQEAKDLVLGESNKPQEGHHD